MDSSKVLKRLAIGILITIAAVAIFLGIYYGWKKLTRSEAELTFPETIAVRNNTGVPVEKIIKALAHYVFEMDTLRIDVTNIPPHLENMGDIKIKAYVMKNLFEDGHYLIFLSKNIFQSELKEILSHEFIHIEQMERGDLIQFPPDRPYVIWMGDTMDLRSTPYKERPFEKEAHTRDWKVYQNLEKIWYN